MILTALMTITFNEFFARVDYQTKLKLIIEKLLVQRSEREMKNVFNKLPLAVVAVTDEKPHGIKFINEKTHELQSSGSSTMTMTE